MNLRMYGGRVPIAGTDPNHPITLVDFPSREVFDSLYSQHVATDSRDRYWSVLTARRDGATLADAGSTIGVTRERARQIEVQFMRMLERWHRQKETSSE